MKHTLLRLANKTFLKYKHLVVHDVSVCVFHYQLYLGQREITQFKTLSFYMFLISLHTMQFKRKGENPN